MRFFRIWKIYRENDNICILLSILYNYISLNYFYDLTIILSSFFDNSIFEIHFANRERSALINLLSYNTIEERAKSNYAISFTSAVNAFTRRFQLRAQCQRSNYAKTESVLPLHSNLADC